MNRLLDESFKGIGDTLHPAAVGKATPIFKGPPDRRLQLAENLQDGRLRYRRESILLGPAWRWVDPNDFESLVVRERKKCDYSNKRITPEWIRYLADREDIVLCGVNAIPAICERMWNARAQDILDFIVAADLVQLGVRPLWGWTNDNLGKIPRFVTSFLFNGISYPMVSVSEPSGNPLTVFWADSITATINLALMSIATEVSKPQAKVGPDQEWPYQTVRRADGGVVLLIGVEHNKQNHCYSDRKDFPIYDDPNSEWSDMRRKEDAHARLAGFARELGAKVLNGAPWSIVVSHPSCDVEEVLNIPADLRVGLSLGGPPKLGPSPYTAGERHAYVSKCIQNVELGMRRPKDLEAKGV